MTNKEQSIEEIVEECFKGIVDAKKRIELAKDPVKQYEIEVKKQLTQILQAERQKQEEAYREGYNDKDKEISELLMKDGVTYEALTQPNN